MRRASWRQRLIGRLARFAYELENHQEWDEHGPIVTWRTRVDGVLLSELLKLTALCCIWLMHNGEDWTVLRALKATACLLLHLEYRWKSWSAGYDANYGAAIAWWPTDGRSFVDPGAWCEVEVSEGLFRWWVKTAEDYRDTEYP